MTERSIGADSWAAELDAFSRRHEGWLVTITTRGPGGVVAVEARDLPLQGVSRASHESDDIAITVGDPHNHFTRDVQHVVAIRLELTPDQSERALVIDAKDGTTTRVEFRSAIRVEEVDGLATPHRA